MPARKDGNPYKRRTALPVGVIKDSIKRLSIRLTADDNETDPVKKLDHKTVTAMSNTLEKLCRIILINDRQGRPENEGKPVNRDTFFDQK